MSVCHSCRVQAQTRNALSCYEQAAGPLQSIAGPPSASKEQQQEQKKGAPAEAAAAAEAKQQQQPGNHKPPDFKLVDTRPALLEMLEALQAVNCVGLDCEGLKLGDRKEGKLSLMQISALSKHKSGQQAQQQPLRIWLVDVTVLAWRSIHYSNKDKDSSICLKELLENGTVTKYMFDVRSDSTQLFHEYGVRLRGVYDLQLAEVAHRQLQLVPTSFVLPMAKVRGTTQLNHVRLVLIDRYGCVCI
jgi:hypothetical protein